MTLINAIATKSQTPISMGTVSSNIKSEKMPRGMVAFANPEEFLREAIARDKNAQMFVVEGKVQIKKLEDELDPNPITLSSTTGLIGTPQQTDMGVFLRCLLNPEIKLSNPAKAIQLENTAINLAVVNPGKYSSTLPMGEVAPTSNANPFKEGYYQIAKVRHIGDTRGNDWYTEVTCYTQAGKAPLQFSAGVNLPSFIKNADTSGG
jgi:hypothetical protein